MTEYNPCKHVCGNLKVFACDKHIRCIECVFVGKWNIAYKICKYYEPQDDHYIIEYDNTVDAKINTLDMVIEPHQIKSIVCDIVSITLPASKVVSKEFSSKESAEAFIESNGLVNCRVVKSKS